MAMRYGFFLVLLGAVVLEGASWAQNTPYGGSAQVIPGKVEAEKYDLGGNNVAYYDTSASNLGKAFRTDAVDLESGSGAVWLAYVAKGEWLKYSVKVSTTGNYTLTARVAAIAAGKTFKVEVDGVAKATVSVPVTGNWRTFQDVVVPNIALTAGNRVIRVVADSAEFNLDYLDFVLNSGPYGGTLQAIPGKVEAEKYDLGGNNVAYYDTSASNQGKAFRTDAVDLESGSGATWLAYVVTGEWLKYSVKVNATGNYSMTARVAALAAGKSFKVEVDGVAKATVSVPVTGGWRTFKDVVVPNIALTAGNRVIRVVATSSDFNLDYLSFAQVAAPVPSPAPTSAPLSAPTMTRIPLASSVGHGYVEYLPEGYAQKSNWPILFFMHGSGEKGAGTAESLQLVINQGGFLKQVKDKGTKYPFVIVAPQSSSSWSEAKFSTADGSMSKFIAYAMKKYKINAKKVYVSGLSMGGGGVWAFAKYNMDKIAALLSFCPSWGTSGTTVELIDNLIRQGVAVWGAHARDDTAVNYEYSRFIFQRIGDWFGQTTKLLPPSSTTYSAMTAHFDRSKLQFVWVDGQDYRDVSGLAYDPPYLFTSYRTGGHVIWDRLFADPNFSAWMLKQSR